PGPDFREAIDTNTKKWLLLVASSGCIIRANSPFSRYPDNFLLAWYSERRNIMNLRALPGWKLNSLANLPNSTHHDIPARQIPAPISRRQFARTAAGSAL